MTHIINKSSGSWRNVSAMRMYWDSLPDGNYEVEIKSTKKRSNDQNAYYFGVVVPMVYEKPLDSMRSGIKKMPTK